MRTGVTVSAIAHAAVILIALIGLNSAHPLQPDAEDSIAVDLVPVTDNSSMRAGSEQSKVIDTKTPSVVQSDKPATPDKPQGNTEQDQPKPSDADTPAPTPAKVASAPSQPAPQPTPAPQPVAPAAPAPTPLPTPEPQPAPAPEPQPQPKPDPKPKASSAPDPNQQLASDTSTSDDSAAPVPTPAPQSSDLQQKRADFQKQQEAAAKAAADAAAKASADAAAKAAADAAAKAKADAAAKAVADAAAAKAKSDAVAKAAAALADKALADAKADQAKKDADAKKVAQAQAAAKAADEISSIISSDKPTGGKTGQGGGTPTAGKANGAADKLSQSELDGLAAKMKECWNPPAGSEAAQVTVQVEVAFNQDGTVRGTPRVVSAPSDDLGQATAASAVRSVLRCNQKYGGYHLPADKFDAWSVVDVNFDSATL